MGWKKVKEHYRIVHFVQITEAGVCIGSPYIHNIIVVGRNGQILKRHTGTSNDDLSRYQREIEADPALFASLLADADTFTSSVPVYTYVDDQIIEKFCEEPGWPNVTHDGQMMYDGDFQTEKEKAVATGKKTAATILRFADEKLAEAERAVRECAEARSVAAMRLARLEADYPTPTATLD